MSMEKSVEDAGFVSEHFQAILADSQAIINNRASAPAPVPDAAQEQAILDEVVPDVVVQQAASVSREPVVKTVKKLDFSKISNGINRSRKANGYPVVGLQSCYKARMHAINLADKEMLTNNNYNPIERFTELMNITYANISEMSIPKPSFETWAKITSMSDIQNLHFGMYAATYPNPSEIKINCDNKKCGKEVTMVLSPNDFIVIKDEETMNRINEVITTCNNLATLREKNKAFELIKKSMGDGIINFYVRGALSVYDYMEAFKDFNTQEIANNFTLIGLVAMIEYAEVIDADETEATGVPTYIKVERRRDLFDLFKQDFLEPSWGDEIAEVQSSRAENYSIEYKTPKTTCPHCNSIVDEKFVNVENMLFFKLNGAK